MALPGPGPSLSLDDVGQEFNDTRPHRINEFYRGGSLVGNWPANAGVPTAGQIAIGNFYGSNSRNVYTITITSNQNNYNAYTSRGPNYVAGASDITYVINPGVAIQSTTPSTASFSIPSAFSPLDTITLVNNGTIIGRGGNGGGGGQSTPTVASTGSQGGNGGVALLVQRPVTVANNGNIFGGGGGGGGGGAARSNSAFFPGNNTYTFPSFTNGCTAGGGGGGGGRGVSTGGGAGLAFAPFLARPGTAGNNGTFLANGSGSSGGTGPGAGGTATGGSGGNGGGAGANGTAGSTAPSGPAARASGGSLGSAGAYVSGSAFVTWTATGSRLGPVIL